MSDTYAQAERIGREADRVFETDEDAAIELYYEAWSRVPEPKEEWAGVTWIWNMISSHQIRQGKFKEAIESLGHVERSPHVVRASTALLKLGRCYYELGNFEKARVYFDRAWRMSDGRVFSGEDPKYVRLLKQK